jgi:DNA-binding response OmpR family regulator
VQSKGCIVIVEPDDLIFELIERWLAEAGWRVASPADALAARLAPQLVVADISAAPSAAAAVRSLRAAYAAPIVAVSARFRRGLGGSVEAASRLDAGTVLPKPFTREELIAAVEGAMRLPGHT